MKWYERDGFTPRICPGCGKPMTPGRHRETYRYKKYCSRACQRVEGARRRLKQAMAHYRAACAEAGVANGGDE